MAWNDPQWGGGGGNKNAGGPPDLDELWKNFNRRLNEMFGKKGGNGGDEPPPRIGGGRDFHIPGGAGLLIGLAVLVWLASSFYIVDAGERGVVLRFGKYVETTEPGPRWHLPYPLETAETVNVEQVRTVEVGYQHNMKSKVLSEALMLTDDENIIDLQFSVQYLLKDPEDYLFSNRSPDEAVKQVAETAMREIVGKSKMDYVLYEGRADIAARATRLMQEILDRYKTGITVSKLNMQNAQPPEQVQGAFDDAVKAGQDLERQKNEGQAYANDVIPKARGVAARLTQESQGYKQRVVAQAEGEASRFKQVLSEYAKAPQVTRERLYQDTMQQILSNTTKVLVDDKQGGNLLYLPLDKLMNMTQSGQMAAQSIPQQIELAPQRQDSAAPTRSEDLFRSRDAFRGRDREARP
ncbi:MAG: FtsH protease activity modulator HflK [Hydrogenophilales bacterium CG17_big_fil_post_rev_8_21_14_2_50_63_12]|nr:MAG: FtsH protease activity modulator HflK [Hydrogenophilales bacterium CG17_big_fil_post_rev_8_21_14_2_50_63_12]PIX97873.1 MAG: FtsH protease activity modulator HflK [Hydrogenophilales bacterium CG_4_10_14_3_um_filter_63_21]PJB04414.1 MAG: FtsH protease activity modulator HflK [Hydrogenophilales bacterium CG_4_9_14_3_um_filter_63_34]